MNIRELRRRLEEKCSQRQWQTRWKQEEETLEIKFDSDHAPFAISLPQVLNRLNRDHADPDVLLDDLIRQVEIVSEAAKARQELSLVGRDRSVYPVMRSTSFPKETTQGEALIYEPHTAESRIYYALDLEQSYTLIDAKLLATSGWTEQELKEKALFNLRGLNNEAKRDAVSGNAFYFISPGDGYAASRILNQTLLHTYVEQAEGEICLAIPHQDVLVIADIVNDQGYDVLQQLTLTFYRQGDMPITMLPFQYQNGKPEPIFILASKKMERDRHDP